MAHFNTNKAEPECNTSTEKFEAVDPARIVFLDTQKEEYLPPSQDINDAVELIRNKNLVQEDQTDVDYHVSKTAGPCVGNPLEDFVDHSPGSGGVDFGSHSYSSSPDMSPSPSGPSSHHQLKHHIGDHDMFNADEMKYELIAWYHETQWRYSNRQATTCDVKQSYESYLATAYNTVHFNIFLFGIPLETLERHYKILVGIYRDIEQSLQNDADVSLAWLLTGFQMSKQLYIRIRKMLAGEKPPKITMAESMVQYRMYHDAEVARKDGDSDTTKHGKFSPSKAVSSPLITDTVDRSPASESYVTMDTDASKVVKDPFTKVSQSKPVSPPTIDNTTGLSPPRESYATMHTNASKVVKDTFSKPVPDSTKDQFYDILLDIETGHHKRRIRFEARLEWDEKSFCLKQEAEIKRHQEAIAREMENHQYLMASMHHGRVQDLTYQATKRKRVRNEDSTLLNQLWDFRASEPIHAADK